MSVVLSITVLGFVFNHVSRIFCLSSEYLLFVPGSPYPTTVVLSNWDEVTDSGLLEVQYLLTKYEMTTFLATNVNFNVIYKYQSFPLGVPTGLGRIPSYVQEWFRVLSFRSGT